MASMSSRATLPSPAQDYSTDVLTTQHVVGNEDGRLMTVLHAAAGASMALEPSRCRGSRRSGGVFKGPIRVVCPPWRVTLRHAVQSLHGAIVALHTRLPCHHQRTPRETHNDTRFNSLTTTPANSLQQSRGEVCRLAANTIKGNHRLANDNDVLGSSRSVV